MNRNEIGKVILRVVVGLTFFIHGLAKFQGGITNIVGYFDSLGIPGFMAYVVAAIELIGGIALTVGLGTRIVTLLFSLIMAGAIFTAKLSLGFFGNGQMVGYELDLVLLAAAIYFVFAEKSKLSLDQMLAKS
ncbi:DoxX family protein [Bacillus sp. DTU_2020_1000418_1_SI_GHA_SEK_038]|uniref:DoxX family protein n=1 Tax=Bacillus sp. DTU_2020_1000418_1_SI_GHA_SEK_038 TaxID=3077585 RepID=UPI0028EF5D97|nr:DoxX family protein [Bacillus sp. DTU_2020_1000418_1_SI_GHA_SEK_038]WNS75445.1 DoxX family protein [Bacillus sp. DTU_2020_1000418_1_SI_GHA_SEK_038]